MSEIPQDAVTDSQKKETQLLEANKDTSGWSQHTTKEGKVFWFHAPTNKSTWKKPDILKTDLERLMGWQTAWKEYATADGIPYWYNKEKKCSVWACPPEVQKLKDELAFVWEEFTEKNVAANRLKLHGVGGRTRFEEALNLVKPDKRFQFFNILTTGEKKQVFSEYQSQVQKQKRERERVRKTEARRVFLDHLNHWPGLHPAALLSDFKALYEKEWWWSCLSSTEHDDLFNDCVEENQSKLEEKQRNERQTLKKQLMDFFSSKTSGLSLDSRWADVTERLAENPAFDNADPRLLLSCWESFVYTKDSEEHDQQRRRIYRAERKRRDAFKDLVQKEIESRAANVRTSFTSFADKHHMHPSYVGVVGVPVSVPRELFEYCLEPYVASYEKEKAILKRMFRSNPKWNLVIGPLTTFEEFQRHVTEGADAKELEELTEANLRLLLESLKRRAQRRDTGEKPSGTGSPQRRSYEGRAAPTDATSLGEDGELTHDHGSRRDRYVRDSGSDDRRSTPRRDHAEQDDDEEEEEEGIVPSTSYFRRPSYKEASPSHRHTSPARTYRRSRPSMASNGSLPRSASRSVGCRRSPPVGSKRYKHTS